MNLDYRGHKSLSEKNQSPPRRIEFPNRGERDLTTNTMLLPATTKQVSKATRKIASSKRGVLGCYGIEVPKVS
jgi:hypothetical protein